MLLPMKLKQRGSADARIEYRWRVDQASGFEKTSLLYDEAGRIKGVDYEIAKRVNPPVVPSAPQG